MITGTYTYSFGHANSSWFLVAPTIRLHFFLSSATIILPKSLSSYLVAPSESRSSQWSYSASHSCIAIFKLLPSWFLCTCPSHLKLFMRCIICGSVNNSLSYLFSYSPYIVTLNQSKITLNILKVQPKSRLPFHVNIKQRNIFRGKRGGVALENYTSTLLILLILVVFSARAATKCFS